MLLSYLTAALWAGTVAATREQAPLTAGGRTADENTFIVTHEAHPGYSLTVAQHHAGSATSLQGEGEGNRVASVCPGATSGYTGYLNKGDKHFYFAFCE